MGEKDLANIVSGVRGKIGRDIALPVTAAKGGKLQETPIVEALTLRERFTDAEREALIADGALVYTPTGETITAQRESQAKKGKPAFRYVVEAGERVLAVPSRQVEVAIYPAPDRFFVPGSFNKNVKQQDELVAQDAADLRKGLGLEGVDELIPNEASTLTAITFQHLDATGKWLFGQEYAAAQGLSYVYGRTKNPTNSAGSFVAFVGGANPGYGVSVDGWRRDDGVHCVGAVRMVVPIEIK